MSSITVTSNTQQQMRIYTEHLHKIVLRLIPVELCRRQLLCRWRRLRPAAMRLGIENRHFIKLHNEDHVVIMSPLTGRRV